MHSDQAEKPYVCMNGTHRFSSPLQELCTECMNEWMKRMFGVAYRPERKGTNDSERVD